MKLFALINKEFQRFFKDPKLIATMLLPGILIYLIYSLMGNAIWSTQPEEYDFKVYICGEAATVETMLEAGLKDRIEIERTENPEEAKEYVKKGEATALLTFSDKFDENILSYDPMSGQKAPQVEIFYRSADEESNAFYTLMTALLDSYENSISNAFDVNAGEGYDLSTETEFMMSFMSGMLPFLIVTLLFSSCMSITLESVAGEKERGTLATVLVTSVKRSHIALGKIIPLSCIAMIGALSSFLGIAFSLPSLMGISVGEVFVSYSIGNMLLLLLLILSIVPLIVSAITVISTYAKSVKEASSYVSVVMILVMVVSLVSAFVDGLGNWVAFIPILNAVIGIQGILNLQPSLFVSLIGIGINVAVTCLLVWIISKMLGSERIMFGK